MSESNALWILWECPEDGAPIHDNHCHACGRLGDELRAIPVVPRARLDCYREALQVARFALIDVARTRRSDAWGNAVTEANEALTAIAAVLDDEQAAP